MVRVKPMASQGRAPSFLWFDWMAAVRRPSGRGGAAMKINCLSCGHKVEVDDAYDDYAGQIKCYACQAIMEIASADGRLKSVKLAWSVARSSIEANPPKPNRDSP